jgi:hypothetical protein
VCTNAASRARDGDPRFAPVALAGYTAADTPDPRVSLLRAQRLANLSPFVVCTPRYDACATKVIVRGGAHAGPRTLGHPPSGCGIDPRFVGIAQASPAGRSSAAARPGGFNGNAFCNKICQCTKSLRDSPLKRVAHLQARSQTRD